MNDDRLTGPGQAYADPVIAGKQRELVDRQLAAMRAGDTPPHFALVGDVLERIRREDGDGPFSLLDAACSSAYYHEIIEHYAPGLVEYTGVDYNPGMVALAGERYPGLPVAQADVRDLGDFGDGRFDVVLSGATLMHIREWRKALSELARVARRWLVLHRTWVHVDGAPTSHEIQDAYGRQAWYYTFNESELMKQARAAGFELVDTYPTGEGIRRGRVLTCLFRRTP